MLHLLLKSWRSLRAAAFSSPLRNLRTSILCAPAVASMALAASGASAQCQSEWLPTWLDAYGSSCNDIEVTPSGDLIVCGSFTGTTAGPFSRIARWDGLQWTSLGAGLASTAYCATTMTDGRLAVGVTNAVMVWDGAAWTQLGGALNAPALAVTVRNGDLVIGGGFTLAGGNSVNRVARWDGTNWQALGTGVTAGSVNELSVLSNGDLVAVGSFTSPGRFVARWDGTTWSPMGSGPVSSPAARVVSVAQDPANGTIWIAGQLQFGWGGFLEQWNGTSWVAANANAGTSEVRSLHFTPTGELMAAGSLYLSGQGPRGIARWNGTSWQYLTANYASGEATNAYDAEFLADGTLVVMQQFDMRRFGCPNNLAMAANFGAGCDARSRAFYESFPVAPPGMDLSNSTLRLSPSGASYAVQHVVGAPQFHTPTSPDLGLADDDLTQLIALPFALPIPGASPVTDIQVGSNGFVNLSWDSLYSAYYGNNTFFHTGPPRHAAMWSDHDPASGTGGGTIHVDIDPMAQVVHVTWLGVRQYGDPSATSTFQISLFATGLVEYRYQSCSHTVAPALVGWSPGSSVPNAGSLDLSAGPFTSSATNEWPLVQSALDRPAVGSSMSLRTSSGPTATLLMGTVIGWGQHNPGIDLASLGMPRCSQYVTADIVSVGVPSGGSWYHTLTLPPAAAFVGAHLYSQGIAFAPGFNAMGVVTSNGVDLRIGTL
jgi:hypothetical protein